MRKSGWCLALGFAVAALDDSTSPPSLWVAGTHGASILHVQPLD